MTRTQEGFALAAFFTLMSNVTEGGFSTFYAIAGAVMWVAFLAILLLDHIERKQREKLRRAKFEVEYRIEKLPPRPTTDRPNPGIPERRRP